MTLYEGYGRYAVFVYPLAETQRETRRGREGETEGEREGGRERGGCMQDMLLYMGLSKKNRLQAVARRGPQIV
jgi:hypothetical protein